jgi:hypothetical protein
VNGGDFATPVLPSIDAKEQTMPTLHLTAQTVKGLQPGISGRTDYFDETITGFGLRVSHGVKSWIYVYRVGGRPRRYTIGRYPAIRREGLATKSRTAWIRAA